MPRETEEEKLAYKNFLANSTWKCCWCCGRISANRPDWWNAIFILERCHIVAHPRKLDIRVVNLLCSLCHSQSHGMIHKKSDLPKLTLENMLWIKRRFDPDNYDLEFMQKCSIRRLPKPEKPHKSIIEAFIKRHGKYP